MKRTIDQVYGDKINEEEHVRSLINDLRFIRKNQNMSIDNFKKVMDYDPHAFKQMKYIPVELLKYVLKLDIKNFDKCNKFVKNDGISMYIAVKSGYNAIDRLNYNLITIQTYIWLFEHNPELLTKIKQIKIGHVRVLSELNSKYVDIMLNNFNKSVLREILHSYPKLIRNKNYSFNYIVNLLDISNRSTYKHSHLIAILENDFSHFRHIKVDYKKQSVPEYFILKCLRKDTTLIKYIPLRFITNNIISAINEGNTKNLQQYILFDNGIKIPYIL